MGTQPHISQMEKPEHKEGEWLLEGGRKQLCEGMGEERRKKSCRNPVLPGRPGRRQSLKCGYCTKILFFWTVEKFYIYHPSHPLHAQIMEPICSKNVKGALESIHPTLFIIWMRLRGWVTLPSCIIYRTPPGLGLRISTAQCFYTPLIVSAP